MQSLVNINRMVAGAKLLNIPIFITEQYPQEYLRLRLILVLQFIQELLKGFFQCNRWLNGIESPTFCPCDLNLNCAELTNTNSILFL